MAGHPTEILDSLGSGIVAVDLENNILFVNRILARRLKINRDEWVGRPAVDLATLVEPHLSHPQNFPSRLTWQENPKAIHSREVEWREDQEVVYVREDSGPLRDRSGRVIGRLFSYHDVSREKAIDRMKSEFIAVASHELRTPMTSIKGSIDLIISGFAGEISADTQELLEIAQKNCDRLVRLINDILDLAKIEAGQIKLKLGLLDLTDAVERAMRGVKSLADHDGITLKLVRPDNLPLVEGDRDRMEQVVTNLLSNAIKFSPPHGEVRVELSSVDTWVRCSVVDQGCGIPEEDLDKVFDKFHQVGSSQRKGGTGLGLAIAQALVNEHKGRIWVESRVNEGSRFIFGLPGAADRGS